MTSKNKPKSSQRTLTQVGIKLNPRISSGGNAPKKVSKPSSSTTPEDVELGVYYKPEKGGRPTGTKTGAAAAAKEIP